LGNLSAILQESRKSTHFVAELVKLKKVPRNTFRQKERWKLAKLLSDGWFNESPWANILKQTKA